MTQYIEHPLEGIVRYAVRWNCNNYVPVKGTFGASELCMHVRMVYEEGDFALTNDSQTYAFVFAKSGRWTEGSFHLFKDGTFSVS